MRERAQPRSRLRDLIVGAMVGFLVGLVAKDLDFGTLVSFHGDRTYLVLAAGLAGAVVGLTPLRSFLAFAAFACVALWLVVALTPLTHWMGEGLLRREEPRPADAVFVLASGLQKDGELSTLAMSRLLKGLELMGQGHAPRLVLSELPDPWPRYREAACVLMDSLGLEQEVVTVGPVSNTHDEAVAVGELSREWGFQQVLVVTSPSHSRRAAAALEAEGVPVVSVPSVETQFDFENLETSNGDDRLRAFKSLVHEYAGLWYYRLRGWIGP